jgi:hypothetical protein
MSDTNEDLEVMFVQDGAPLEDAPVEEKPEGKVLSQAEYDELVRRSEAAQALGQPIARLAEGLAERQQPVQVQQPGETDEEFYARIESQAFMPGQFGRAMKEVQERTLAPVMGRYSQIILDQAKKLMRVDPEKGETFRKYERDIDKEVEQLPKTPDVYEVAYQRVMMRRQPEIMEERLKAHEVEIEKKVLEKYGIDPASVGVPEGKERRPAMETVSTRSGGAPAPKGPQALRLYESERDRMLAIGLDPKDPRAVSAFLKNHPRRK